VANLRIARRSGRILRGGRMRRESIWFVLQEVQTTMAAANTAVLVSQLNAAALALRPFTVVRTRQQWFASSDQQGAVENYEVALGQCVVSDQAAAIGITAVPTPFTDLGSDLWFLHEIQQGRFVFISGVGALEAGKDRSVDSRAMRKVEDGDTLITVLENSSLSAGTFNQTAGRQLIKLH